ncbi:hypothetical protein Taro_053723 [Colocasia esculenta]|uniref:Uncharacterized protein n=1 Tax=Colocasia esculenta TaxID=4460 RepID=A0A843XP27_COLES|nr:hypothetical protein [Colocasia esculenta]
MERVHVSSMRRCAHSLARFQVQRLVFMNVMLGVDNLHFSCGQRQRQQKHLEADFGACFVKLWRLAGCYSALKAEDGGLLNLGAARACARAKQEGGAALEHVWCWARCEVARVRAGGCGLEVDVGAMAVCWSLHGELRWPASWAVQEAAELVSGSAKRIQEPAAMRWRSKLGSGGLALVCVWRAPDGADLSHRGSTTCVKQHRLAGVCCVRWLRWTAGRRRISGRLDIWEFYFFAVGGCWEGDPSSTASAFRLAGIWEDNQSLEEVRMLTCARNSGQRKCTVNNVTRSLWMRAKTKKTTK